MPTKVKAPKTRKPPRTHRPRVKQPFLKVGKVSMAPPSIPALDDAADGYYDAMQERCKLSKVEDEAKRNLIDKMHQHGVGHYVTADGLVVDVTDKTNVRVKKRHEENGEAG